MLTLVLKIPGRSVHYPVPPDKNICSAGYHPDNDIHLPFPGISKYHFSLINEKNNWIIVDNNSKNGTFLNQKKIKRAVFSPGDTITAGSAVLLVKQSDNDELAYTPISKPLIDGYTDTPTEKFSVDHDERSRYRAAYSHLVFPEGMVPGRSTLMMEIYQQLNTAVRSQSSILLNGETGVGKEMIARTIHLSSPRAEGPFIAVNCAAIPKDLAEAELFGIGRRVATEVDPREGHLNRARGGTLFLDEISSFDPLLQAKLLRALEEKVIHPIGTHESLPLDFRLITATNQDPRQLMEKQVLRQDFYHRIATIVVTIPPLRRRREDIEPLIYASLDAICAEENKALAGIGNRVVEFLLNYSYPGNIRELLNILRSMVVLAYPGEILNETHLPQKLIHEDLTSQFENLVKESIDSGDLNYHRVLDRVSEQLIRHALHLSDNNIARASEILEMSQYGLRKAVKRLKIDL